MDAEQISGRRLGVGGYVVGNPAPTVALRASVYVVFSLVVLLVFVFLGETEFSVYFAASIAITSALIVERSNRDRPQSKLITIFFWLAAGHAIYGYWAAGNSTDAIWMVSSAELMFRRSLLVIAATLLVAAFTYDVALRSPALWAERFGRYVRVSEERLILAARGLALLGILCVLYVIVTAGFMPMLAADPGRARYISDDLGPAYLRYAWVLSKGLDLLACSVPLVLFSGLIYRRKVDLLIGVLGILGILVTLQRAHLISVFVVLMLTISFVKGKVPRKYVGYLMILVAAYYGSELVFLNAIGESSGGGATKIALLSALPEVRDLGWTMSLVGDERFYGLTFVEPMILGSGIATDFRTHYALGNITARLIGLQRSETGGLRITVAGEGYLNFGALGCLVIGVVFGLLCTSLSRVSGVLLKNRDLASSYLVAVLFVWLCFWLYLAGTEATGVVKNGLTFVFALFLLARVRRGEAAQGGAPNV